MLCAPRVGPSWAVFRSAPKAAGTALTGLTARSQPATPYLLFCARPPVAVAAMCAAVASVEFSASLVQQERLMDLTPAELAGQALGLHSSGMLTLQGVSASLAGAVGQLTSPAAGMTVMAAGSVGVTPVLATAARRSAEPGREPAAVEAC